MPENSQHIQAQIKELQAFANGLSDWVWMIDLEGNHTFSNSVIERRLGYTVEEFLATPFLHLVHIDDAAEINARLPKLVEEKKGWEQWVIRWRAKSGEYVHYSSSATPILDENDKVIGFRGIDREQTFVNDQMQSFKDATAFWESAFEHLQDILIIADKDGQITFANNATRIGTEAKVINRSVFEFVAPKYEHVLRKSFEAILDGQSVARFETKIRRSDGTEELYVNRLSPVLSGGSVHSVVFHSTNMTESRRVDSDLRKTNSRLQSILKASTNYVFTLDRFGKITYANHVAEGYVLADIIGQSAFDFLTEASARVYRNGLQKVFDTVTPLRIEVQDIPGEWFEINLSPLGTRNIQEVVVVGQNITKSRETARQLLLHRERSQSLLFSSRDFILCLEGEIEAHGYADCEQLFHLLQEKFTLVETNAEVNMVLMGDTADAPDGKQLGEVCAEYPLFEKVIRLVADQEMSVNGEMFEVKVDGELQYWEIFATTISHYGTIHRIWITGRNQTASILDKLQIAEQKRQNSLIFELSPVGISFADGQGNFLKVNPAMEALLGYSEAEMLKMSYRDITDSTDIESSVEKMQQLIKGEINSFSMRKRYRRKDGSTLLARLFVSASRSVFGDFEGSVAIVQDIEHELAIEEVHKQHSRDLERMVAIRTKELELANDELKKFSYSVSHDLRAPLRAISGFTSMFLQDYGDVLDEEGAHFLNQVVQASGQMKVLIDSLLELSRLSAKEITWQPVDVSAVASRVAQDLNSHSEYTHVSFEVEGDIVVDGDEGLVASAITNLLENAAKYSHKNPNARVRVQQEVKDDMVVVSVADNGVGFDEQYKDRLFTAFQRLHSDEEFVGTGIGLASVQRVVHRLGGTVGASSTIGEGATFTVSFPKLGAK